MQLPFSSLECQFYLLVETFQNTTEEAAEEQLLDFLETLGDLIEDGVIAQDEK